MSTKILALVPMSTNSGIDRQWSALRDISDQCHDFDRHWSGESWKMQLLFLSLIQRMNFTFMAVSFLLLCLETPTEAMEAHFSPQESSSTHRIWVRFHRNEESTQDLSSFHQDLILAEKSEPLWLPWTLEIWKDIEEDDDDEDLIMFYQLLKNSFMYIIHCIMLLFFFKGLLFKPHPKVYCITLKFREHFIFALIRESAQFAKFKCSWKLSAGPELSLVLPVRFWQTRSHLKARKLL